MRVSLFDDTLVFEEAGGRLTRRVRTPFQILVETLSVRAAFSPLVVTELLDHGGWKGECPPHRRLSLYTYRPPTLLHTLIP